MSFLNSSKILKDAIIGKTLSSVNIFEKGYEETETHNRRKEEITKKLNKIKNLLITDIEISQNWVIEEKPITIDFYFENGETLTIGFFDDFSLAEKDSNLVPTEIIKSEHKQKEVIKPDKKPDLPY